MSCSLRPGSLYPGALADIFVGSYFEVRPSFDRYIGCFIALLKRWRPSRFSGKAFVRFSLTASRLIFCCQ